MIHLQMNGFIADNLFQYCVGRIVAEELGYELRVSHSRMHPRRNVPQLLQLLSQFRNAPIHIPGLAFEHPVDKTGLIGHDGFDGFHLDLQKIVDCRDQRKIMLAGYFQQYAILRPYKSRIRAWFEIAPLSLGYDIHPDDVVVHVRMGDLVVLGWAISLNFYSDLLDTLQFRKLYICGFGLGAEVRNHFARFDPIYVHSKPVDDFRFMKGFNRIILSNSGFSWWAAFLSDASEIHAPVMAANDRTFDPKSELADLRVDDEARYHYVYDVPYMERAYTLKDILISAGQLSKRRLVLSLKGLLANPYSGDKH
ncbi:MAG: hypothetical protein R3E64_04715 [Halioglobus sp.]